MAARAVAGVFLCAALLGVAPAAAQTICGGHPSAGTLRNGRRLEPRPFLALKKGSENRAWAHPVLLQLLNRGARAAALAVPGSVALVGDLSAEGGGPISGHASHQSGRDADVAFFASDSRGLPVALEEFEPFGGDGRSLRHPDTFFDTYRNWLMLREWLSDLRVVITHVFVSAEIRQLLLEYGRHSPEFSRLLPLAARVLTPYPNHSDHFHVRIACPSDQDGTCGHEAFSRWFSMPTLARQRGNLT